MYQTVVKLFYYSKNPRKVSFKLPWKITGLIKDKCSKRSEKTKVKINYVINKRVWYF